MGGWVGLVWFMLRVFFLGCIRYFCRGKFFCKRIYENFFGGVFWGWGVVWVVLLIFTLFFCSRR